MENKQNGNKDKRISFLSIFSSITQIKREGTLNNDPHVLSDEAFRLNEELYKKYPLEEENAVKIDKTDEACPTCGGEMEIRSSEKNGRKWRGMFCKNPECEQKPKWLKTLDIVDVEEGNYKK